MRTSCKITVPISSFVHWTWTTMEWMYDGGCKRETDIDRDNCECWMLKSELQSLISVHRLHHQTERGDDFTKQSSRGLDVSQQSELKVSIFSREPCKYIYIKHSIFRMNNIRSSAILVWIWKPHQIHWYLNFCQCQVEEMRFLDFKHILKHVQLSFFLYCSPYLHINEIITITCSV